MEVTLRAYTPKDLEAVCEFIRRVYIACIAPTQPKDGNTFFLEFFTPTKNKMLLEKSFSRSNIFYIAEYKGNTVGIVRGRTGYLTNIFVDPKWQGKGVGSLLMKKIIQQSKQKGAAAIRLKSAGPAESFYVQFGFKKSTGKRNHHGLLLQPMKLVLS